MLEIADATGSNQLSIVRVLCTWYKNNSMSYLLPHLRTGWAVDQAIINEEERVVCLRFGHDHDVTCMQMDEVLAGIAEDVKNFCAIYVVDVSEVRPTFCRVDTVFLGRLMCIAALLSTPAGRGVCPRTTDDE